MKQRLRKYIAAMVLSLLALVSGSQSIFAMGLCTCSHKEIVTHNCCCDNNHVKESHCENHHTTHTHINGVCSQHNTILEGKCLAEDTITTSSYAIADRGHKKTVSNIHQYTILAILVELLQNPSHLELHPQYNNHNQSCCTQYLQSSKPLRAPPVSI